MGVQLLVLVLVTLFISFFWISLKFYFVGKLPVFKACLMLNNKGLQIADGDTFSIWIMILFYPWSFFGSKIWIVWSMPSMEIFSIKMRSWWQLLNIIVLNLLWNLIPASFLEIMGEWKVLSYNLKSFAVKNKASL